MPALLSLLVYTALAQAPDTQLVWAEARELAGGFISMPQNGPSPDPGPPYQVWVWAESGRPAEVTLGDILLSGPVERSSPDACLYEWFRLSTNAPSPGPWPTGDTPVSISETIAILALSANRDFDPRRFVQDRRVLDQPGAVRDRRALHARHTNTVYTMPHFESLEEWEQYAQRLRRRILLSSGLWPVPDRTPLNVRIFDRIQHADYSVEKARFEAWPGFYVTGNLYRPTGEGPFPAVLCPHGHWSAGRLEHSDTASVPGRGITLAKMGIVVFSVDMLGYNDSIQYEHRWSGDQEKLWGIHPFALQLWSNIRAVDFLAQLDEVDPDRIGCTGASGGGTQTFALMAVDARIKAAAPVNMISSTMQGGCVCENAPILRLDGSNMEIGALMAPRPLLLVSAAGDWTRETPRVEFPAIQSVYRLYGREDRVRNVHIDAPHNYNKDSREAMYRFFGKWLLGEDEKSWSDFREPGFTVEKEADLRLFPEGVSPPGTLPSDAITRKIIEIERERSTRILPATLAETQSFQDEYRAILEDVFGATVPNANDLSAERVGFTQRDAYVVERWILHRTRVGDAIPALFYRGTGAELQDSVLLVHGRGKGALAHPNEPGPGALVQELIEAGRAVLIIDPFLIGEHHSPFETTRRHREGGFMDTFNPTDMGYRIQDVLTAAAFLRSRRDLSGYVDLIGLEDGGMWALFASAIDGKFNSTLVDAGRFETDNDQAWAANFYTPCIRAVGDVTTAGALIAPGRLAIFNTAGKFDTDGIENAFNLYRNPQLRVFRAGLKLDRLLRLIVGSGS